MAKETAPSINLAKNRGEHLSDRILAFALTIGRMLIIVTEAIALGAFLYRFGLDRQLVDLHDKISQEQAIVKLLQKDELIYRNLQNRLSLENQIAANSSTDISIFQTITDMLPSDMTTTLFAITPTDVKIEGTVPSLISLSTFVKKLKSYSAVARISVDKLENKTTEGVISISLSVFLKPNLTKPLSVL